jgi:hypothetical protein
LAVSTAEVAMLIRRRTWTVIGKAMALLIFAATVGIVGPIFVSSVLTSGPAAHAER